MAYLLAQIVGYRMVEPPIVLGGDKRVDMAESGRAFEGLHGQELVVPGFYAVNTNGEVVTFSRGGSDITGAIIASLSGANLYENWTDVDGIYDCDPNKNPLAKKFERLTYEEAHELSKQGAEVLHHKVYRFVQEAGIPIHLRNTFNRRKRGTIIHGNKSNSVQ